MSEFFLENEHLLELGFIIHDDKFKVLLSIAFYIQ